jgi:hypothetical protein
MLLSHPSAMRATRFSPGSMLFDASQIGTPPDWVGLGSTVVCSKLEKAPA